MGEAGEDRGGAVSEICSQKEHREIRQVVSPAVLRERVLTRLHDDHGHQGIERMASLVRTRCYWPGMFEFIEEWCKKFQRCTLAKDKYKSYSF